MNDQATQPPEPTPISEINDLIQRIKSGHADLTDAETTAKIVCDGPTATSILLAHPENPDDLDRLAWAGTVTTSWHIDEDLPAHLIVSGWVDGDLGVWGSVDGSLAVWGWVDGDLEVHHWGLIAGSLTVRGSGSVSGSLAVSGSIDGNLTVRRSCSVGGSLAVSGSIGGYLAVLGSVGGYLTVSGSIDGSLTVRGSGWVGRNLTVSGTGSVGRNLTVRGSGSVGGNLTVSGSIDGSLEVSGSVGGDATVAGSGSVGGDATVAGSGSVGGNLTVSGSVDGYLEVLGSIDGYLAVRGSIGGDLKVHHWGSVGGYLEVSGSIDGDLTVRGSGSVGGDLVVSGSVKGAGLRMSGQVEGRTVLTPTEGTQLALLSVVGGRFGDEVFIGDAVSIDSCDFRRCPDLSQFALVGRDLFTDHQNPRLADQPYDVDEPIAPAEMASIYRRLRKNLEDRKDRPAAGLFYRGEMDARQRAAVAAGRKGEAFILAAYRVMSGYGLKVWRPLGWFVATAVAGALLFGLGGFTFEVATLDPITDSVVPADRIAGLRHASGNFHRMVLFSVRSMVGFFSPPTADLSWWEWWIQLALRFAGPILLTQATLGVREKVAR